MGIEKLATEVFDLDDYIIGAMSGGIEAPRMIKNVIRKNDREAVILFEYPAIGGYSDCHYHDTRAGKLYEARYHMANGRLSIKTTKGWTERIFEHAEYPEVLKKIAEFKKKYGITNRVIMQEVVA